MTFQELLTQIQTLKLADRRIQTTDYLEAVVEKDFVEPLCKILTEYFGGPLKPGGQPPSGKASRIAQPHGGVRTDQAMYFRQDAEHDEYALLWPWGTGTRVTVKIIQSKNESPQGGGKVC